MKSYVLTLGVLGALVAAGFTAGCSDDDTVATGSAGAGATSGAPSSSGGEAGSAPSKAGGPTAGSSSGGSAGELAEAGAAGSLAGSAGEAGSGEAGASATAGTGGTAGTAGSSGSGGSGGKAGGGGTGGTAGTTSGGTGGTGGTGGASGGTGGTAGTAGAGGGVAATLFIPASLTCASGNVLAAYSVCRNCHGNPLSTTNTPPIMLVSYADVTTQWKDSSLNWHAGPVAANAVLTSISAQLNQINGGLMPLNSTTATTFIGTGTANAGACSTNGTISCKNVLLNWLNAGAPGVTVAGGLCP